MPRAAPQIVEVVSIARRHTSRHIPAASRLAARGSGGYTVSASYVQELGAMPETTFTFRVDQELKKAFTDAARANDRPGSQLLRDFMRNYVERAEHDAWFRGQVEQSLREADDPSVELIPHHEVVRKWKARRAELIKKAKPARAR
jgi:predicted transcriptional regulator